MPRNRRPVPREEKREELLAAAAELFVVDGYEATSMTRLARRAGVTPNTLYWYFRDKDELLVAVADRFTSALLDEHASLTGRPVAEQLSWLVQRLRPVRHLVVTMHSRVAVSDAVRTWHTGFHTTFEALFTRQLPGPIAPAEIAVATFALEGAITHDLDDETTRQLCAVVADRLHHATATDATTRRPE